MYANGTGVQADAAAAAQWFRRAAEQGLAAGAQTNLGARYVSGRGVTADPAAAALWFERAARQRGPSALFNLGVLYGNGAGVAQDAERAFVLLAMAARRASGADATRYAQARATVGASLTPTRLSDMQTLAAGDELPWPAPPRDRRTRASHPTVVSSPRSGTSNISSDELPPTDVQ